MTRKILVKGIAILFILKAIWSILFFISTLFSSYPELTLNITEILVAVISLQIGLDLFKFKDSGRKIAIFFLLLYGILGILFIMIVPFIPRLSLSSLFLFVQPIFSCSTVFPLCASFIIGWKVMDILIALFFLQRKTKELFL